MTEKEGMTEAIAVLDTLVKRYTAEQDRVYEIECYETAICDITSAYESFKDAIYEVLDNY